MTRTKLFVLSFLSFPSFLSWHHIQFPLCIPTGEIICDFRTERTEWMEQMISVEHPFHLIHYLFLVRVIHINLPYFHMCLEWPYVKYQAMHRVESLCKERMLFLPHVL